MEKPIDVYLKASGADESVREDFDRLVSSIPKFEGAPKEAAIQIKNALLLRDRFSYDHRIYNAQDVISQRKGNCLGLPLIIGAIMGEFRYEPRFNLIVRPKDEVDRMEQRFKARLDEEMRYDKPELAIRQEDFPVYRFTPLEHLVLDVNGGLFIETTTLEDHSSPDAESMRSVSFREATSCVYKDRAIDANNIGYVVRAQELAQKGLVLWPQNRQIYSLLAAIAHENGDHEQVRSLTSKFSELDSDDSLFYFDRHLLTGNPSDLDEALVRYPTYAQAVAMKAHNLIGSDRRESKFLYALASQLYANSNILNLGDFYAIYSDDIADLFGHEKLDEALSEHQEHGKL